MRKVLWWLIGGSRGGRNRLRIILTLDEEPMNANQLADDLDLNYKTVRHHLELLADNDVVTTMGDGYGTMYFLSDRMEANMDVLETVAEGAGLEDVVDESGGRDGTSDRSAGSDGTSDRSESSDEAIDRSDRNDVMSDDAETNGEPNDVGGEAGGDDDGVGGGEAAGDDEGGNGGGTKSDGEDDIHE